jgi:aryl-alcohol dehydrogenase
LRVEGAQKVALLLDVWVRFCWGVWESGRFPVDALITTFPSTDLNAAMHAMHTGHAVKPVLVFPDTPRK